MDLYQIWFRGSFRGRNQLCGILLQSAHWFRFCGGGGQNLPSPIDLAGRRLHSAGATVQPVTSFSTFACNLSNNEAMIV